MEVMLCPMLNCCFRAPPHHSPYMFVHALCLFHSVLYCTAENLRRSCTHVYPPPSPPLRCLCACCPCSTSAKVVSDREMQRKASHNEGWLWAKRPVVCGYALSRTPLVWAFVYTVHDKRSRNCSIGRIDSCVPAI